MYKETQKLHLIEELLKTDNEAVLAELQTVLNKASKTQKKSSSAHDFSGRWTKKDAGLIEKASKMVASK